MIRLQCVKLKAQTHLNMPIVYSLCTIVWISLQKYFQLFHIETTFIINLLRSSLILSCQHGGCPLHDQYQAVVSPPTTLGLLLHHSLPFLKHLLASLITSFCSFRFFFWFFIWRSFLGDCLVVLHWFRFLKRFKCKLAKFFMKVDTFH